MIKAHEPEIFLVVGDFSFRAYRQRSPLFSDKNFIRLTGGTDVMANLCFNAKKDEGMNKRMFSLSLPQMSNFWQSIEFSKVRLLPSVYVNHQAVGLWPRDGVDEDIKRPLGHRSYFVGNLELKRTIQTCRGYAGVAQQHRRGVLRSGILRSQQGMPTCKAYTRRLRKDLNDNLNTSKTKVKRQKTHSSQLSDVSALANFHSFVDNKITRRQDEIIALDPERCATFRE